MVWWVLSQGVSGPTVSLLVLCIFLPLNIGVLLTGVAVDRFGSRRLLIVSKLIATCGALACFLLLATNAMTLVILAILAIVTYGAMSPSISADISRVPAITKLAGRRLESFHAANGIVMVAGQMIGLIGAGLLWDATGPAAAVGLINLQSVFVTAAIIATAQGCIEVAFPIAVAAAGLPAKVLSMALVLAVITGVAATVLAERFYSRVQLTTALLFTALTLLGILLISSIWPGITGFYIAVGATSAAAAAAGTFTITALQERMPISLQAQAIGLWEFLVLSVGSVTILFTGFTGSYSLYFITFIALVSTIGAIL